MNFSQRPAGTTSMFGNPSGGTGANLFAQPNNTGFPAATGTPNLFTGATTGATTPNLFGNNPQPTGGNNLFNPLGQTTNTGGNTGVGGNLFSQPTNPPQGGNLFSQPTNPSQSINLFGQPATNTVAPSLFSQPQTGASNNLFALPNQMNGQMNPMNNMGAVDDQQQMYRYIEFIKNHKKDSLRRAIQNSFMELGDDNTFKNERLSRTQYQNLKTAFLSIIKKVSDVEKEVTAITGKNKELFGLIDAYNNIARQKLSFFKKCFLEVSSKSNTISEIKDALDEYEKLAEAEFDSFYQSIKNNRYTLPVITPSDFEMKLSEYTLRQAQNLLDKLNDYERCQQSTELATYVDVVPALIEYYKNVTCLVYEFRERFAKFRDEIRRNRGSSFIDIESKLEAQKDTLAGRTSTIFEKIIDIQNKLKEKIQHCSEVKKKFKVV